MSALLDVLSPDATLLHWWQDSLLMTALLIAAVLILRRPVARMFGARLAYALWALPGLRLIMPALPGTPPNAVDVTGAQPLVLSAGDVAGVAAEPDIVGTMLASPWFQGGLLALWLAGGVVVLARGIAAYRRYRRHVMAPATQTGQTGRITIWSSPAAEGPVALGLLSPVILLPADFTARYSAAEQGLALAHEMAHHRNGDLWANAFALLLLAAQWWNPLAWTAWRAFRFDQEAACDARVLAAGAREQRSHRTADYAAALLKTAAGPRLVRAAPLSLASPMSSHASAPHNLKERMTMLTRKSDSPRRAWAGRLLLGGALVATLAATATILPASAADPLQPPAPPAPPQTEEREMMIFASDDGGEGTTPGETVDVTIDTDGIRREVRRVVMLKDGQPVDPSAMPMPPEPPAPPEAPGSPAAPRVMRFHMPMAGLSREETVATLVEQGVDPARARVIAERLEAKRAEKMPPMPPLPPMPPMPPVAAWSGMDGAKMALADCSTGARPRVMIQRKSRDGSDQPAQVKIIPCGGGALDKGAELAALKKARARFAADGDTPHGVSADIRKSVIADMDNAIADLESAQ